jgi:hypothetical protein
MSGAYAGVPYRSWAPPKHPAVWLPFDGQYRFVGAPPKPEKPKKGDKPSDTKPDEPPPPTETEPPPTTTQP